MIDYDQEWSSIDHSWSFMSNYDQLWSVLSWLETNLAIFFMDFEPFRAGIKAQNSFFNSFMLSNINYIVQPGGSIKDQDSIDFCNKNGMSMVFSGIRHFRH